MYEHIIIGLDQSYTRTGITICADGVPLRVTSEAFKGCKNKTEKRIRLALILDKIIQQAQSRSAKVTILCERIRLMSAGSLSINYIKATGALLGTIVDTAYKYDVKVFSADTRSWKAQVVGSSKADDDGNKKMPTILFVVKLGFEDSIKSVNRNGKVVWDDDAADSCCIALYGFKKKDRRKLQLEE